MALSEEPSESEEGRPRTGPVETREDGRTILTLVGHVDVAATAELVNRLASAICEDDADVVVDLEDVESIGAPTIEALAGAREVLRSFARDLIVRASAGRVRALVDEHGSGDRPPASATPTTPLDALRARHERVPVAGNLEVAALLLARAEMERAAAAKHLVLAARFRWEAALDRAAAGVDELTGVLRRGAGFAALQREIDRARRSDGRLVVGFVDVDGLKRWNDTRGHHAGDEVLRRVASALQATVRSYDVVVRVGGDEFVLSLAGSSLDSAAARLEQMRASLLAIDGHSVSAGFAELRPDDTLETLVARADADLYERRRARREPIADGDQDGSLSA